MTFNLSDLLFLSPSEMATRMSFLQGCCEELDEIKDKWQLEVGDSINVSHFPPAPMMTQHQVIKPSYPPARDNEGCSWDLLREDIYGHFQLYWSSWKKLVVLVTTFLYQKGIIWPL